MSRGKRNLTNASESPGGALQFGHGCEPWKTRSIYRKCHLDAELQFGHGCEPWKTRSRLRPELPDSLLQFGHGCEPWKTRKEACVRHFAEKASIRPRL